jgi:diguanylate cyclase (GGDEF)-like protein/PAS domain S-box-containing protein
MGTKAVRAYNRSVTIEPSPDARSAFPFDDAFHKTIVDNLAVGVYYVDEHRQIVYWNKGAERISGFPASDVVGRRCHDDILSHVDGEGRQLCQTECPLAATLGDGEPREVEVWLRHREGYRRPVHLRTAPVQEAGGHIVGAVEAFEDASWAVAVRADAESARRDALIDALTGLPNRRHVDAALDGRLENLRRYGWAFGLLLADIDHFKAVNDRLGHAAGDEALRMVAGTLAGGLRAGDFVGRWGGEEFVALVENADRSMLLAAAERLRVLVARSIVRYAGREIPVRISLGGALARADDNPDRLLGRADAALYAAKDEGRDRVALEPPCS